MMISHKKVNRAAILFKAGSPLQIQCRPIPMPGPGQLLLRSHSIAINPADWMMQESKNDDQLPCILGSDVAGTVEGVGPPLNDNPFSISFQPGDCVLAFAGGAWSGVLDEGAFQQYAIVLARSTTKIPPYLSFEKAATLPMASATAASALWVTLGIPKPIIGELKAGSTDYTRKGILIYGASASVGILAVQMAARQGFQVFAVASSKHEDYIRGLGAQHFIDRGQSNIENRLIDAIKAANVTMPIRLAFDAVSSRESLESVIKCLAALHSFSLSNQETKAKLAITLKWPLDLEMPQYIDIERTSASHFHIKEENSAWLFNQYLTEGLQRRSIVPGPPVRIIQGGLEGISKALDICKKGLSCEKLVLDVI